MNCRYIYMGDEKNYPDIATSPKLTAYFDFSIDAMLGYEAQM